MIRLPLPRSVFGQLVLVIGLVLLGAAVLAVAMGRQMTTRPAAVQLLKAMDGFADVAEELARTQPHERVVAHLRDAGLAVSELPPPSRDLRAVPVMRELIEQAPQQLTHGREVRLGRLGTANVVWLKLDTQPALWVSFALDQRASRVLRFSVLMLIVGAVLVWLAAAYYAHRLVVPLRRLAQSAPAIVRGESPSPGTLAGPQEVEELARALADSSKEVREAAEERALMLAGISHDLRTPLTRLQYAIELVPGVDSELRAGMHRDIADIDAILSQFIAYARDGRDEASEPLDLAVLCRNAISACEGEWQVDTPAHAPMTGRPMALLRAVGNLLVNAQRHGAPPYALALSRQDDAWCVDVVDHGPGLPEQVAERARQPFVHGEGGGTGLGLAIVERVARQHGGELRLAPLRPHGLMATLVLHGS
ncbi:HAMP domain-containing histidine kinase [Luteibacter sp. UNCMF366Tsu5.1]|uniref:HAMP domain-containing histidine kinase n=1 Tax=Luteibacter sp. UNCMF366Tsu5.1 TaxID=1502758 RepID=UPI000908CF41|nr:HAMP domain-containing histidine kinase [Luteibacter sp. UNCMF366Tsu5.1]SFW33538.1 two-component system, OmpR family, osmolarity sensor histidine kinase EnvZ [Luteibacter sp. UNCMF366Tsu5.1]